MPALVKPIAFRARLEALPHRPGRRPVTRSSAGERRSDEPPASGERREMSEEKGSPRSAMLRGVRVLVVDDNEDTTELLAAVLGADGADVATATSAPEALSLLVASPVDVVVSDIAMPGADGYWLVREIRRLADARVNCVPVLAVTAYGREHSKTRVLAAGFTDHLQKPVDPDVLCRMVARAAGR
jgi:CheY-like chemotaxis protein